jgi:DNA-binding transcriptional LysR family regulator
MTRDAREPSLELLQTLLLFVERGSVAAVSRTVRLDEAVISRRLGHLRDRYGLLSGRGRALALTEKGRDAVPLIRALLQQQDRLADWLKDRQPGPLVLTVATGHFAARFYLPGALARFAAEHPDWLVRVQVRRGRERVLGVADGTYDLAIVSHDATQIRLLAGSVLGTSACLSIEDLAEHALVLVARQGTRAGDALAQVSEGQTVPLARLVDLPLVGLDAQSGLRRQVEAHFRGRSPGLCFRFEAGGWEAVREYARHGLGAALLPVALLQPDDTNTLIVRPLEPVLRVRDAILLRDAPTTPHVGALREALFQAARELRDRVARTWGGATA